MLEGIAFAGIIDGGMERKVPTPEPSGRMLPLRISHPQADLILDSPTKGVKLVLSERCG
jgi:hypothetical protein